MTERPKIIVPGLGGSGETHWQTRWEAGSGAFTRIAPDSFDAPVLANWLEALDREIRAQEVPPVIVSHSLGCLLTAEFLNRYQVKVAGVFMVAVPDPNGPNFPHETAKGFGDFYRQRLPCPAIVLASGDDPYAGQQFTATIAKSWGADVVNLGNVGHVSEMGDWTEGRYILAGFCAGAMPRNVTTKPEA